MFRTLIYPSSGACDYSVELPHCVALFLVRCVLEFRCGWVGVVPVLQASCGPEGVYVEMLKHGTDKPIKMLTWVINRCLNGEETPQQWKVAYISTVHKKGSKKDCSNYRSISVTSVMSRLYGKILRDLIEEEDNDEEEQSGFRTGRSCTDNNFCIKQIIEKRNATNQETHLLFVDLTISTAIQHK